MKRIGIALLGGMALAVCSAATAFAQSDIPPGGVGGEVVRPPGAAQGTTAFTGSNVQMWMVLAAALLIVGVALLVAARRRARAARG